MSKSISPSYRVYFGLFLAALILSGCYPRNYYRPPQPAFIPEPSVQSGQDGVRVTVIPSYWTGSPANLQNYVTAVYVEIENFSNNMLVFDYNDIVLFDDFRTQYSPLSPQAVAEILSQSEPRVYAAPSYPRVSIGIGAGYYGGYYGRPWGYYGPFYRPFGFYTYSPVWYYPPAYYYSKPVSTKDVVTEALIPGPVYPNASVEGYIYFKQIPLEVTGATLDISYGIEGTPEYRTLSFPLPVSEGRY